MLKGLFQRTHNYMQVYIFILLLCADSTSGDVTSAALLALLLINTAAGRGSSMAPNVQPATNHTTPVTEETSFRLASHLLCKDMTLFNGSISPKPDSTKFKYSLCYFRGARE